MHARHFGGLAVAVFAAATIVSGCDCGRGAVDRSYGEIGVVFVDETGAVVTNRDALYDFGTVALGDTIRKKLVIQNLGTGPLTLVSVERVEGDVTSIGIKEEQNAAFDVRFAVDHQLDASETVEFDMFYTPHAGNTTQPNQQHYVKLTLLTGGSREEESTATIVLKGKASAGSCELADVIDFGKVAIGDTDVKGVTLTNDSAVASNVVAGDVTSTTGDHLAFPYAMGSAKGAFVLEPGASAPVNFQFKPTETRAYSAKVVIKAGTACSEKEVTLTGEGVDTVLEWAPTSLDFLYVSPGQTALKPVTFKNHGSSDVEVFDVQTTVPADFGVKSEPGSDPTKFVVPGNSERQMMVICKPSQLGPRSGELRFRTPIAKQPMGSVTLTCFGGGPEIDVKPSGALTFGKVAYFPSANPPSSVTRRITVMNVGSAPPNGNPDGNLRLGKVSATGAPGQLPYVSLKPLNGSTAADEISIGIPPTYAPSVGLEAKAGKNLIDLTVTLTPKSLGLKEAELTIYSNDPDEPETKLILTSDVVAVPPCNYTVAPAMVNFGLVTPGTFKEVPVTFTNNGVNPGDICLFSGVDLAPGTDPSYSMPNGAVASQEVGPGQSLQMLVRVEPMGTVPNTVVSLTGTLQYYASSPTKPQGTVPLTTAVGPSCLTIAPAHKDFGTSKPGCATATSSFTIYNVCSSQVTLSSITMQEGAGQQPGGPNCPGAQKCPEFHLVQTPSIPSGGLAVQPGGSPVSFQAKYKPLDLGADSGVIAVNAIQNGISVTYLVTLEGEGDSTGIQSDVFIQDAQPRADVLFVIDNSCSMDPYQTSLANNFASFIQYATSANVDYQIGVTTTDMGDGMPSPFPGIPAVPPGDKGRLRGDATNPKILTPSTPNVAQKFQDKVKVGTDGDATETGLEPSLKAITPPLSVADNAGFVRPDANLAVVVVTDAPDQSGQSSTYYVNSLLNVKGFNKANMFTFNAIAGFAPVEPTGCPGVYDTGPDDGTYAAVVSQTNGIKEEICTQNWAAALQGLGKTAFGFRTTFFLTSVPSNAQPVGVLIDGVNVPPTSGSTTNWYYDAASNAIVFDPMAAPSPGQTLTITYATACLP